MLVKGDPGDNPDHCIHFAENYHAVSRQIAVLQQQVVREGIAGQFQGNANISIWIPINHKDTVFVTRGQFLPPGVVVAYVCLSVRPSVEHPACPRTELVTRSSLDHQLTLTLKSQNLPHILACRSHNSSPIQAMITEFGPDVQNIMDKFWLLILAGQIYLHFKMLFQFNSIQFKICLLSNVQ